MRSSAINRIGASARLALSGLAFLCLLPAAALFPQTALANSYSAATPDAGIIASYTVEITPTLAAQHQVNVRVVLPPQGVVTLQVSRESNTGASEQWVSVQDCYDQNGKPVAVENIDSRTWKVDATSGVTIEYQADVNVPDSKVPGAHLAYLSDECGLILARSVLLTPDTPGKANVGFVLPDGWSLITDETWVSSGPLRYVVDTADFDALVAPGKWDVYRDTFGDGQKLTVAIWGETRYEKGQYIESMKTCLDYFDQNIGKLPQQEMNVVVAPLPLPTDYMSTMPRLAVTCGVQSDWGMFEAVFWHYWFLRPVRDESQRDGDRAWWFGEALSPFFLNPVYERLGVAREIAQASNLALPELTWKNWYLVYRQYQGGEYDIPLVDYPAKFQETFDRDYYYPLPYMKGSLVLELLDNAISEATNGTKDISDLARYIYDKYIMKGAGYKIEDILQAANGVAGVDFAQFFNAYVYGSDSIPIITVGKDYFIDWTTLGTVLYPSLPNEEEAAPRYSKVPVALELKKDSKHFSVYFHPRDEQMATLLLLGAERAYAPVSRVYGGELKLRVKMFLTYDPAEYMNFGAKLFSLSDAANLSAGEVAVESGDEINWLNPIRRDDTQSAGSSRTATPHELGHIFMRQLYPGTYGQYWLSWFSEGLATYADQEFWLQSGTSVPPLDSLRQLADSCLTGNPPLIEFSRLEDAGKGDEESRLLSSAESLTFMYYVAGRYGDGGLRSLLAEYSKGVSLSEAVERAFGISFADQEGNWEVLVKRAAENLDRCDSELTRIRRQGFDVSKAESIKTEEPYLALFLSYLDEAYGTPGPVVTTPETSIPSPTPQESSQPAHPSQEQPPVSSFPWPLVVIAVLPIGLVAGIVMLVRKRVRRKRT